jgi:hypothetical protein
LLAQFPILSPPPPLVRHSILFRDLGPANNGTKVGNGSRRFAGVDGRSRKGRRLKELYDAYRQALGPALEVATIENLAWKRWTVEEVRADRRGDVSLEDIVRVENSLERAEREARQLAKHRQFESRNPGARIAEIVGCAE